MSRRGYQLIAGVGVRIEKFALYTRDMLVHRNKVLRPVSVVLRYGPEMIRQVAVMLGKNGIRVRLRGIAVGLGNFLLRLGHRRVVVGRLFQMLQNDFFSGHGVHPFEEGFKGRVSRVPVKEPRSAGASPHFFGFALLDLTGPRAENSKTFLGRLHQFARDAPHRLLVAGDVG